MPPIGQQRDRLRPAKTFFDTLPFLLADAVARVVRPSASLQLFRLFQQPVSTTVS